MLDERIFVYFGDRGRFRNKRQQRKCRVYTVDVYQNPTEPEIFFGIGDALV
jgi:hypothetical protein